MSGPTCRRCGHRNEPEASFCSSCGAHQLGGEHEDTSKMPLESLNELLAEAEHAADEAPYLVVRQGPMTGARFALDEPVIDAGRHPDSGIFLDDVTVSRRHARFVRTGTATAVTDVGSLNGTYVNRMIVERSVELRDRDVVQIGKFKLVYLDQAPDRDG